MNITVPFLDANIVDVTVVKWHRAVGDMLTAGEVAVEISTDKAAYEIEAPVSGRLISILAPEKSVVPVKYILGVIGEDGENADAAVSENSRLMADYRASVAAPSASTAGGAAPAVARSAAPAAPALRATPKARRFAQANGIDLAEVQKATGAAMITEAVIQEYLGSRG